MGRFTFAIDIKQHIVTRGMEMFIRGGSERNARHPCTRIITDILVKLQIRQTLIKI
jgi:hypothetical protein